MKLPGLKEKVAFLRKAQAQHLPFVYIISDKEGRYQFMTDIAAQHTGFQTGDELINLKPDNLNCEAADYAKEFKHYGEMSAYERQETLLLSRINSAMGASISLISTKPLINEEGEIEGIETWAQILPTTACIEKVIEGYKLISTENASKSEGPAHSKLLTLREQECVYYLTRGFTFLEIAKQLCISPRTVETHVNNIKMKLGVKTRAELIIKACDLGYVQINLLDPNFKADKLQLLDVKPWEALDEIVDK